MKYRGYLYVALATTLNIFLNALTFGNYLWLEGRVRNGVFRNWGRRYRYRPERFATPSSEAELVELIKNAKEDLVVMINDAANEMPPESSSLDLAKKIFEKNMQKQIDPLAHALSELKKEIQQVF